MIYTHTYVWIYYFDFPHTAIKCWQVCYVCLQVWIVSKPFFLLCIYTPPKKNMAIVKNNQLKMYLPSINDDLSGFVHFHVSFTGTYTSQPAATFPLRVPNVPKTRAVWTPTSWQNPKLQNHPPRSEKNLAGERAGNSEGDGFLLNPCNFSWFFVKTVETTASQNWQIKKWDKSVNVGNSPCLLIFDYSLMLQSLLQVLFGLWVKWDA